MTYLVSALALLVIGGLHFWWKRRYRRLEEARARTESQRQAQQQSLFDSMAEGVLILDSSDRIQLINQSLEKLFALTTDVRGQTVLEAFRLELLATIVNDLREANTMHGSELELPRLDERWLRVNASAIIDKQGVRQGSILVFHDLTRLKQLENTRREFVANVSHELRTPLSLIKGFVETLLEGAKNDPDLATRFLHTIEKHTDRLTFLIEDLLTISRLESGRTIVNLQPIDLRQEVQRVMEDLQTRTAERKVSVQNEVSENLIVRADADRLQQVLYNLVENAIKYGRNEGEVSVGAKTLEGGKVEVWVRDNGPGIPAEAHERVFERFYRVDRARSRETGGTGLGLAIVKHIVQAHGGEVWVESKVGVGTTFHFTLLQ
jgi:two-component system phosphate regulon sensor histidine kinase PhoR